MSKKKGDKKIKSGKKKEGADLSAAEIAPAITQVARSMRTVLGRNLLDTGLYAGQDGVILTLAEEDGLTPGQLALRLGVKAPTMTRTIGRMEAQGFVERRPDADDARLTKVYLTEAGRNSVSEIESSAASCDELATRGFSEKDIRSLVRLLKTIDHNLQAGDEDEDEDEF